MPFGIDIQRWVSGILREKQLRTPATTDVFSNSFAYVKGRMFGSWVDVSPRDNGFSAGDLIENPAYIIESLLRDENFTERDLTVTTVTADDELIISGLVSRVNDYYNGAIYYNVTTGKTKLITDYVGATKTIILEDAADTAVAANDNVFIQNIQGDNKINYASFDVVGNTTDGNRNGGEGDWRFARSYTDKNNIRNILDELCFDAHCELVESVNPDTGINQFKLIALDILTGDTWTNPGYSGGLEQVTAQLTPLENVFTQFRLKYFYDYGKGDYIKELYVDKNGFPTTATVLSATEQTLCADAETNYQVSKIFEFSSMNIYQDNTAEKCLQKKIQWFTKQRLLVRYLTPIIGNSDYIKYEVGDQVKLNFAKGIPSSLNNTAMFMITSKTIKPALSGGQIQWELIEMGVLPS